MTPAKTQHKITKIGEPNSADIGAIFLNTPEPTITLTTKIVAARNPILGVSFDIVEQVSNLREVC
ncbi:hypothetical protein GCM10027035_41440 [Emticicia sediminis]